MSRGSAYVLAISFFLLTALGFVMQLSTNPYSLEAQGNDAMRGFRSHGFWFTMGLAAAGFLACTDYHKLQQFAGPLFWICSLLLALCLVPGVGVEKGGASRWLSIGVPGVGSLRGQPSEVAKIAVVIALAAWMTSFRDYRLEFLRGFFYPLMIVALPVGLIAAEVDLGTASLIFLTATGMLFIAGSRVVYVVGLILVGAVLLGSAIKMIPNRTLRITAFIALHDPEMKILGKDFVADAKEIKDMNLQQREALIALGSGGLTGVGIGDSRQKQYYLPLPHTDSVFGILGEEGGLVATLGVILLFLAGGLSGVIIAMHAPDRFGKLLGFGLMSLILGQAAINIGVTTGCLPNKGMPLPFISYGGSNLFSCLSALGIMLNIYFQARRAASASIPLLNRGKLTPAV